MWIRISATLLALASTACLGDNSTPAAAAADHCRTIGGVPFGSSVEDLVCLDQAPLDVQVFGSSVFDTDHSPLCGASRGAPAGCLVAAATIAVEGRLRAVGDRPLILVANAIDVTARGVIDVAAHSGDPASPAGAGAPECEEEWSAVPGSVMHCATGGSFGGIGGNNLFTNETRCAAEPAAVPTTLRGGCAGRRGATFGGPGGLGGEGGGAILLIADTLTINGLINASGAGGAGAGAAMFHGGAEGGGGGSGGMIALDARSISGTGVLMANGGGGGTGDGAFQMPSPSGSDPDESKPLMPAPGGPGLPHVSPSLPDEGPRAGGGAGGAGSALDGQDGDRITGVRIPADLSAGGGGGSVGVIRFYDAKFTSGIVSPTP